MPALGVNIDHVATIRQARRGQEPDPLRAAHEAELGGADCITIHLREDRRHIQDHDLDRLLPFVSVKMNLEMAATDEMVGIALSSRPHMVTLVPEGRAEITTEGGLDVARGGAALVSAVKRLRDAGILVSAFIAPEPAQIRAAADAGFHACELHTGPYAAAHFAAGGDLLHPRAAEAFADLYAARDEAHESGLRCSAGHALNYANVGPIASLDGLWELHIGHAIVSRAVFTGLRAAVAEMKRLIDRTAEGGFEL